MARYCGDCGEIRSGLLGYIFMFCTGMPPSHTLYSHVKAHCFSVTQKAADGVKLNSIVRGGEHTMFGAGGSMMTLR